MYHDIHWMKISMDNALSVVWCHGFCQLVHYVPSFLLSDILFEVLSHGEQVLTNYQVCYQNLIVFDNYVLMELKSIGLFFQLLEDRDFPFKVLLILWIFVQVLFGEKFQSNELNGNRWTLLLFLLESGQQDSLCLPAGFWNLVKLLILVAWVFVTGYIASVFKETGIPSIIILLPIVVRIVVVRHVTL